MKKLVALLLVLSLVFSLPIGVSASELEENTSFVVWCPTFPDAYIITESTLPTRNYDGQTGSLGSISATVFLEEQYDVVDGELVVTSSHLLSEQEVLDIGIENFDDFTVPKNARAATNSRGKLTITFAGTYSYVGNGVSCELTGTADWASTGLFDSAANIPATGEDFIGVTWSGGFSSTNYSISGTTHLGGSLKIYEVDSLPNSGRVWSFSDVLMLSKYNVVARHIDLNMVIQKNRLEGNGNTAEAVLKYIHTYSKVEGSITITPGDKTTSGSFTLSNTDKQWSLVCTVTDIPY